MPTIACDKRVICQCAEDSPFGNLSAELPDQDEFFSVLFFEGDPPLGTSFEQLGCKTLCRSTISQEDADLCALRQAQLCTWDSPGFGGDWRGPPTIGHPNGTTVSIFANTEQQCTVNCADGTPFTKVVKAGTVLALSQVQANAQAHALACKQANAELLCLSGLIPFACQNTFFEEDIAAFSGPGNDSAVSSTWNIIAGMLPNGLSLVPAIDDPFVATIQGTPTTFGVFTFTIQIALDNGNTASKTYSVTVGGIVNPSPLPDAPTNTAYSQTLTTSGMTAPLTWTVIAGPLPTGLTLDANTGVISGTPTVAGTYAISIQAQETS